ncbi:extracellular solute-binding protein [Paenibacillus sp. IB182496]|uniref:Extracellular solute-binding protein n=1 Tax=Paenibacillus sabuli TaxID=2772509 RepID=A0A927BRN2_9BACL|nr:extracellular solute-binding protein [Paenibacillus sabuli]MBD2845516.1 extracellular solute-binding protein [Paenibacillus sabuli]
MAHTPRRWGYAAMGAVLATAVLSGCSGGNAGEQSDGNRTNAGNGGDPGGQGKAEETRYIEVWRNLDSTFAIEKDGPYSKMVQADTGVGLYMPFVAWNSGSAYVQKLNTRIASGELPDLFMPWQGNEAALMKQGALADLTELLPEYAPHVWDRIPQEVWDVVRSADPSGEGRIYYVPLVQTYTYYGAYIRQDWLDNVGMELPRTKDEYVEVLRAFRDQDANGNGDPSDEIPVTGREQGRWMDHLFGMYGVAMWEGLPMWDLYDGELTYSAITPNMKAALEFAQMLYRERLLDPNTFLNKGSEWTAKIYNDKVGSWYHINQGMNVRIENIAKVNPDVNLVALGLPEVDGYDGFITNTQINRPMWVIADKDEQTTIDALSLLEWSADPAHAEQVQLGVEGMHYEVQDGKRILLPSDPDRQETRMLASFITGMDEVQLQAQFQRDSSTPEQLRVFEMRDAIVAEMQPYGKTVAGDGIPSSIYDGYSDLKNHTMYQEYMSKIIIGEWPIDKFDEFVDKWTKSGGEEVTARARAWYNLIGR